MERRDVGYCIAYILSFVFVATIGVCFSAFLDAKRKVEVRSISVNANEGILVQKIGEKGNETISKLKVKSPKVGTKPITGELDTQTDIPYTVSDQIGSEGAYAKFQVKSSTPYKIVLKQVSGVSYSELQNVKIAISKSGQKPLSLSDVGETLAEKNASEKAQKFTILVWLDNHVGKDIVGSKIDIVLEIVPK